MGTLQGMLGGTGPGRKWAAAEKYFLLAICTLLASHLVTRFLEVEFFVWEVLGW